MIAAGDLTRRITIRRATVAEDAANALQETWADLCTVWASKTDIGDAERVRAQQVGATITTRFVVRWNATTAGVTPKDRVIYGALEYDISAVKEVGERDGVEITAAARADG